MNELFPAGKPVVGNTLIGREKMIEELTNVMEIGQSVILMAPRRYGKTSVALATLERLKKAGWFTAQVDIFNVADKRQLAEKIIESCFENNPVPLEKYWLKLKAGALNVISMLKFKPSDEDIEMVLQLGLPKIDEDKLLENALNFPERFGMRHKRKIAVFLDEFQETVKIGGDSLLKKMRSNFQRHKNATYIFAGSQETLMTEIFQFKKHAFYRFGRLFEVGNITKDYFAPYIIKSFSLGNIFADISLTDSILEITGGHPYYTQLLCQIIYIDCLKEKKDNFNITDVKTAENRIIEHETALFDEMWKELGNKKHSRNVANLIAKGSSPYSISDTTKENIARILTDMMRLGFISKSGTGKKTVYSLKDPFFKKYLTSKTE